MTASDQHMTESGRLRSGRNIAPPAAESPGLSKYISDVRESFSRGRKLPQPLKKNVPCRRTSRSSSIGIYPATW
eukprot:832135-Prorocentrum_minimum.AAC.2